MPLSRRQGPFWVDTLIPAHALEKSRSFFVALELSLDVCDHDFQPKQPSWVPRDGGISRDALYVAVKRGLSPGPRRTVRGIRWRQQEAFSCLSVLAA